MNLFGIAIQPLQVLVAMFVIIVLTTIITLLIAKKMNVAIDLGAFWEYLKRTNSEDNGNPSHMRFMTFVVVMLFAVAMTWGFFVVMAYYENLILQYAGILLIVILGALKLKQSQKKDELKLEAKAPDAIPPVNQ